MANRTLKDAKSIKGTNPQYLVEKIIRTRIYDCQYWKEECFALTGEYLVDRAMGLDHIGGVFSGNIKPTPFLCLILKMLQIQPSKDIVIEFIKNPDYKYVRCLGAMYLRIIGTGLECYKYLEPLYNDYRKIKFKNRQGKFVLSHVDEFVDDLLRDDRVCDVILPRIQKRHILEELDELEPRVSALDEDLEGEESDEEEEEEEEEEEREYKRSPHRRRSYSRSPRRRRSISPRRRSRSRSHSPHYSSHSSRRRSRSRSPRHHHHHHHHHRHRSRSRSRSPYDSHHHHRRRSRSYSRSRSRSRSRSPRRRSGKDRNKSERKEREWEKDRGKEKSKKESKSKSSKKSSSSKKQFTKEEEEEIRQSNELRAQLGLKPLRVD